MRIMGESTGDCKGYQAAVIAAGGKEKMFLMR